MYVNVVSGASSSEYRGSVEESLFGLQAQNLVGISPAVGGVVRVESLALAGAQKREYVQFANV